mgnify:CR=1 FL=1
MLLIGVELSFLEKTNESQLKQWLFIGNELPND